MLVERVTEFAKDLFTCQQYNYDYSCSMNFQSYFLGRDLKSNLTVDDYKMLLAAFRDRWLVVKDSSYDYTLHSNDLDHAKKLWIELAKDLCIDLPKDLLPFVNINHMHILTDAVNDFDYNDEKPFTTDDAPDHFYLGFNTSILYRRKALLEHLIKDKYVLSTWSIRTEGRILRALTVEELVRLNSSIMPIHVEDNTEQHANFGEFLQQRVYPKLNPSNVLPLEIMPYFLLLIERYFSLKDSNHRFQQFKEEFRGFLSLLYENDLGYLNQFYGVKIQMHGKTCYLIECLIILYHAQDYNLDADLTMLLKGLYELNPSLRIEHKHLEPIYSSITTKSEPTSIELTLDQIDLNECKLLLLSLFTLPFSWPIFSSGQKICLSDQEHTVNLEASKVYKSLEPYISTYDESALLEAYRQIMSNDRLSQSPPSIGLFPRQSFTSTWLDHVKSHTLSTLGVRWYNPKLLLHAMIRFPSSSEFNKAINPFLDELIRTYCQDRNKVEQQVRINILFSKFVNKYADSKECKALLLLLDIYAQQDYRSSFISNCDYYIASRLNQLKVANTVNGSYSFTSSSQINSFKEVYNKINYTDIVSVRALINIYVEELERNRHSDSFEKLHKHIIFLSDPFLTCAELLQADCWRDIDPVGAPT